MVVQVNATVLYSCWLDEKQAEMVRQYAEEHSSAKEQMSLEDAVMALYADPDVDFDLYKDCSESDCSTDEILSVEED